MHTKYDTIVVGLGAMGSASLYQLAKRGHRVLGIDRFSPPHHFGSTHGDTRITRQAIGEGAQYTPLALRSYQLWREIEEETGKNLLQVTGGLIISSPTPTTTMHVPNFFDNTVAAATKFNIEHEILDAGQIRKKFPQFRVQDHEFGYYEHLAGFLRPENCVQAQLSLAQKYGADIHTGEKVESFTQSGNVVRVKTDQGEYQAVKLVVSTGPWLPTLLDPALARYFTVSRQVLYWFDIAIPVGYFFPGQFPIFIWELPGQNQGIYGFPALDGQHGGLKIATEQYEAGTTADTVDRDVTEEEMRSMYRNLVAPYFPGLCGKCVKAISCLYTVTPDSHFVIDTHPRYPSVIIASPCSGHGFKHSAAIGEAIAQLVIDGKSSQDLSRFTFDRLQKK